MRIRFRKQASSEESGQTVFRSSAPVGQTVSFHCYTSCRLRCDHRSIYLRLRTCLLRTELGGPPDKQLAPIKCSPRACVVGSSVSRRRSVTSSNTRHACRREWPRVRSSSAVKSITPAYPLLQRLRIKSSVIKAPLSSCLLPAPLPLLPLLQRIR